MQIGFVGLGRMGHNMVQRIMQGGAHGVVAFDKDAATTAATAEATGAAAAASLADLVGQLEAPRTVWVMVPAGAPTVAAIAELADLLEPGDVIVDGGNSRYTDDQVHAAALGEQGIDFIDVGTSGGIWGLANGYCLMVGGADAAVAGLAPVLDALAPPPDEVHGAGWMHVGATGAGHYAKMVHNGIEYGLMQAYAEGFALLDASPYPVDHAALSHLWMRGSVVRSWLLELAAGAFEQEGGALDALEPWVEDSGEGRWTVEEAIERRVPMPVTSAALFERFSSRGQGAFAARFNAALRNQFGGHAVVRK
ncbi:MAG: gnd [Thermoleophilia bacterium]|nr:gnd [Thermoleophilia bacterium]